MKRTKRILILLTAWMSLSWVLFGCSRVDQEQQESESQQNTQNDSETERQEETEPSEPEQEGSGAAQILQTIWSRYGEEETFAAAGGDAEHAVMNAPTDHALDDPMLTETFGVPGEALSHLDEAASLYHMMNVNTFSCAVVHFKDAGEIPDAIDAIRDTLLNRQWVCGIPDGMIAVTFPDGYLLTAFGENELLNTFRQKMTDAYPEAAVALDQPIGG